MLDNRIALVTGAGTEGIGRAIALGLAEAGADIAIHAHSRREAAEGLAKQIRALGRRAEIFPADLADPAAARAMVGATIEAFGRLDILVNNAATIVRKPFLELTDEDLTHVLAVNLGGYFACAQEVARDMVARGALGRIIMISSVNQMLAVNEQAAYCASKGGIMQLAKVMALELAPLGINVNLIAPGTVETDINRHLLADPAFRRLREEPVPMKRLGTPEDVAGAALFLASDASRYVTGTTIVVDGGLSLP